MRIRQRTIVGLAVLLAILGAALAWDRLGPGATPPGQPPLVTIDEAALRTLRAEFNRHGREGRLVLLLSPT